MRNVILLAHISLDGFMAGPDGDMSFITHEALVGDPRWIVCFSR